MLLPKFVLSALYRRQITAFLGMPYSIKMTKDELIDYLYSLIAANTCIYTLLLEAYPFELAVGPTETQQILHCTVLERKRWIQEGRLPVLDYRMLLPTGISYPVHHREIIMAITPDEIAQWRAEHQQEVHLHRIAAVSARIHMQSGIISDGRRQTQPQQSLISLMHTLDQEESEVMTGTLVTDAASKRQQAETRQRRSFYRATRTIRS
jgi:hypothetical protein